MDDDYNVYAHNREHGVQRPTLAGFFGAVREEQFNARYAAETRRWLGSTRVTEVCDRLRAKRLADEAIDNAKAGLTHCPDCEAPVSVNLSCACWAERE